VLGSLGVTPKHNENARAATGTKRTCQLIRRMSASAGKADMDQPPLTKLDL
jgi:hypothetical protein